MKKPFRPQRKQPTTQELRDELLRFIQTHFYPRNPVGFAKDTPRLLKWVVLKLADYLDERAVTISTTRYLEIMRNKILMEAVRFGRTDEIRYVPSWLGKVVETHLDHNGEEYYEEAKAIRNLVENALTVANAATRHAADPIREMATASRMLTAKNPVFKRAVKSQLELI